MRYSEYEWNETEDGTLHLAPTNTAQPSIYDALTEHQRIVLDALILAEWEQARNQTVKYRKQ